MREAHRQIGETAAAVTPPVFEYEAISGSPNGLIVHYDSPRKLCHLHQGAFEGAGQLYGEQAQVHETQCMLHGAPECIFFVRFLPNPNSVPTGQMTGAQQERWQERRALADLIYNVLPDTDGVTLTEVQQRLRQQGAQGQQLRPFLILEAITVLHHVGWATSTVLANGLADELGARRYWRLRPAES